MKRLIAPLVIASALAATQPACYGSYGAFNAVHKWNGNVTGSKVTNSVIHFAFWVVPVYPIVLLGDWLIFNNVEFVTGTPVFK